MHDDQLRGLLRSLETGHAPDPAFADALYARLGMVASAPRRSRTPMLLLAAALLGILVAGVAVGSGLFRVPVTAEASPTPFASPVDGGPSPEPSGTPVDDGLAFEAPDGVLPPNAEVVNAEPLELRQYATPDAQVIATVPAGETLLISGPLVIDGARWYNLTWREEGQGGWTVIDPTSGAVELLPVVCPSATDLDTLSGMTAWARLACLGDREITIEGYELVGFGGVRGGTYEPEWLNGFLGEFALSPGDGRALFVRVEPGTVDVSRPPVGGEIGSALLRVTGHFNHPASVECSAADIPVGSEADGRTADLEPIAAELECREQFVVTGFEIVDEGTSEPGDLNGRVVMAMANRLGIRADASESAAVVTRVNAGQTMGVVSGPVEAGGLRWYEVQIGPTDVRGWITSGPDGEWLRLVDDGEIVLSCPPGCGPGQVASVDPFGGGSIVEMPEALGRFHSWTWSRDGSRVAGTVAGGRDEVAVANADGSDFRILGAGYGPSWSPDGTRLAWLTDGVEIVVTDSNLVPTVLDVDVRSPGSPSWSPDGQLIAFGAIDCPACPSDEPIAGDPPSATWIVGVDGNGLRQVTGGDYSYLVDWSPDGSLLMFLQVDLSGEFPTRAYQVPVTGGERGYMHDQGTVTVAPAWSPDGARMVYSASDAIFVSDGPDGSPMDIAPVPDGGLGSLAWSPSGRWVLYTSIQTAQATLPTLWIAPADGREPARQIDIGDVGAYMPQWLPVLRELP